MREVASQQIIAWVEDAIYVSVAVMLVGLAGVVLWHGVTQFLDAVAASDTRAGSLALLDNVLLVLMLVELLHTVSISIRENVLVPRPFLIVGLIAAVRRVLILTAEQGAPSDANAEAFRLAMLELAILAVLIVGLVWGIIALARSRTPHEASTSQG